MSSFRTAEEMSWTDGARRSNGLRFEWTVLAVAQIIIKNKNKYKIQKHLATTRLYRNNSPFQAELFLPQFQNESLSFNINYFIRLKIVKRIR